MRADQLIDRLRQSAFIGSATYYPAFTDAKLLDEINDRLRSVFADTVVAARAGYWLAEYRESTVAPALIPPRAVTGGLESVAWKVDGIAWQPLDGIEPHEADRYAFVTGNPRAYYVEAESVTIVPTPQTAVEVRLRYYLRPSELVTEQSNPAATVRGRIDSVNVSTRTATVNAVPLDQLASSPTAIVSGALVDVIRPAGWFSPVVVSEACSISGTAITLAGLSEADFTEHVRVGHFVRAAGQTDWAPVPEDFHRLVADAAAVKVLMEMGLAQKAQELSSSASAEFERFKSLIYPRSKSSPKRVRLRPYWVR